MYVTTQAAAPSFTPLARGQSMLTHKYFGSTCLKKHKTKVLNMMMMGATFTNQQLAVSLPTHILLSLTVFYLARPPLFVEMHCHRLLVINV
jgi:hypothetical protein